MKWFKKKVEVKENPAADYATYLPLAATFKAHDLKSLLDEGYSKNPTIYRCVREIAVNAARIPLYLEDSKGNEIEDEKHPLMMLLRKPNVMHSGAKFIEEIFTDYLTGGNRYIVATTQVRPKELWRIDPLKMTVVPGRGGVPKEYIFNKGQPSAKIFAVDSITGKSDILHGKTVNPLDNWYGLPPLMAAAVAGDMLNSGLRWNYSLLENGGRPSGALTTKGTITEDSIGRVKELRDAILKGSRNAGTIPILTNGLEWQSFSESPKDMDFATSLTAADKYIAMVYGVPLPLIGTEGSTYNNIALAQEKLYEDTVIPLFEDFINDLNMWLVPMFGDNLKICLNLDAIPALEGKRQRLFDRYKSAVDSGILSRDEAREAMGYEPRKGMADRLLIPAGLRDIDEPAPNTSVALQAQKLYAALLESGYTPVEAKDIMVNDLKINVENAATN